jgi:hypothetical protein
VPFDGSDHAEDWSDKSEPWMLDPDAGRVAMPPLESAPTQVGIPKGSTVVMEQPVAQALTSARGTTLEMSPEPPAIPPVWVIAAGGVLLLMGGAAIALAWAIFS